MLFRHKDGQRLCDRVGVLSALYGLIGGLMILNADPMFRQPMEYDDHSIASVISYIKKNYSKNITVTELADLLHFSRSYFSTLFKKVTGMSPQQFLVRHRLWLACRTLAYESFSITAVANSVGYEASAFTQVFRRTLGISPTKFCTLSREEQESLINDLGIGKLIALQKE